MWHDGPRSAAAPRPGWTQHRRFLADLFAIYAPTTLRDLTSGEGAAVALSAQPTLIPTRETADLILIDRQLPSPDLIGADTLVLIADWDGQGEAVLMSNGLAVVPGSVWQWLLTSDVQQWVRAYVGSDSGDTEVGLLRSQIDGLREVLEDRQQRVEILERELLSARDEIQQLLPLEVSPKAQLYALRRSIPISVRKRLPSRRGRLRDHQPVRSADRELARLKGVSLQQLLQQHYDQGWVGYSMPEYLAAGLSAGRPVSAEHEAALAGTPSTGPAPAIWGPVELVTPTGRRQGSMAALVEEAEPDLVTVDVWDTLIVRDRPADAAKLATARRMWLRPDVAMKFPELDVFEAMAVRVSAEAALAASDPMQEYLLDEVVAVTLGRLGGVADESSVAALVNAEVSDEIEWTRARPDVAALVQQPSIAIASDFYMDSDQLGSIVSAAAPAWSEVPLYVSVERGCSKRLGGGLLDLIRRDSSTPPSKHLHVGDNAHSDVSVQVKAGGAAIQVQPHHRFPGPGEFGPDDLPVCDDELRRRLDALGAAHPTGDQHRIAGRQTGPLAVALVAAGLETAYRTGVDRVHYVSREGIFLASVHEIVEPLLRPPGAQQVQAVHLALSRRATFGASLQAPYRFSLQRMWSMYARQSPRAMLVSIGVDPLDFFEELAAADLQLDEVVKDARRDNRVERFLNDPAVEAKITSHVERARALLRNYVLSTSVLTEPFVVADVGWRGTIQDNLVRALGIASSHGVYFGLFPFLNAQPPGSSKVGVAFDGNLGEEFAFADPPAVLERPWTPDVPSTIGFEEVAGQVEPLFDKEAGHVSPGIEQFQRGTLDVAPLVAAWMSGFGLTTEALRPQIARWAHDLWQNPPAGVADIWFSSDHDDSFGALNHSDFGKTRPGPAWVTGDLYRRIEQGMAGSGWAPGYRAWQPVAAVIELGNL